MEHAVIVEVPNAFEPFKVKKHVIEPDITIRQWLQMSKPGFVEFPVPTICVVNGVPVLRKSWNRKIKAGDIVTFMAQPKGYELIIWALVVVAIAISIYVAVTMDVPTTPGELPGSAPVFSTKGQYNQIRLGEPIEVCYGRNRVWPSLASRPYFQYQNNNQFQYVLFCLGQGEFEIHQLLIGDTDIEDYEEVEYEVAPPGTDITLFPTNVVTSVEVGGQMLLATNEAGYGDGYVGPFPTNPAGTQTTKLQIDIILPKGLYWVNKKGQLKPLVLGFQWQARLIDDAGAPLGSYFDLFSPTPKVINGATVTPQRRTYTAEVPAGRYESRLRRTNSKDLSHKAGNDAIWEGMRAYVDDTPDYGDVTLLAVKIRATNNLNDRTQTRFNVIHTRKLPIRVNGESEAASNGWTDPIPTRSIVWAFVDVFRAQYGARVTDEYFDWDTIYELDALYASREEYFDWCFRDPITVWEAAKAIARVGRATPLLIGSLISLRRESSSEVPVALFNQDNIVKGSFKLEIKLWDLDEHDSISVEYTETETGYKQEQVTAVLPGGTTYNPEDLRLIGIQDRAHAYREGLFVLAQRRYLRENVTFDTGMEAHMLIFGDLIAVSHDVPRWGQGGYVAHAIEETDAVWLLYLTQPLVWEDTGEHQIMFRGSKGEIIGPFTAEEGPDSRTVYITYEDSEVADFLTTGMTEPMLFQFGPVGNITKYLKVVKIEPKGGEEITVTAVTDDQTIYSFDELEPSPLDQPTLPPEVPDLPTIAQLYLTQVDDAQHIVQIAWTPAFGAQRYVVETSEDGENWTERVSTTQTSIMLQVRPGDLWVRVAGINNGQGPWTEETLVVSPISGLDEEIPWEALEWRVAWFPTPNAMGYMVRVYDNTVPSAPVLKHEYEYTNAGGFYLEYDYSDALVDSNVTREMLVEVDPIYSDDGESGTPAELELSNTIPEAPESPAHSFITEDSDGARYRFTWDVPEEDDLVRIALWISATPGFDPEVVTPVYDETFSAIGWENAPTEYEHTIELDSDGGHAPLYWRVALFDVWGNEIDTNITAQGTIPEYPA